MSFSEKLQKLRKENKLSQEQLADMLDVTRQSVSKWESGTTYPEMDKLITMCKIFKCSLDDLTNDEITDINVEVKKNNQFNGVIESILDLIEQSVNMFSSMKFKKIIECIISLIIIGLFLTIFHIPFGWLEDSFSSIISGLGRPALGNFLSNVFTFLLDIIYYVLYILVFVYIYKIAFLDKFAKNRNDEVHNLDNKENTKISESDNTKKEVKIIQKVTNSENAFFSILSKIVLGFTKFLLACFSIPLLIIIIFGFVTLAIDIYLLCRGVLYFGILFGIVFALLMCIVVFQTIMYFLFNKPLPFKKLLICFLVSIAGIGLSIGITTLEFYNTEYIDKLPPEINNHVVRQEFKMNDNIYIENDNFYYDYYEEVFYVIDETYKDKIVVEVECTSGRKDVTIGIIDNGIEVTSYIEDGLSFSKKLINIFLNDLSDKTIYNYNNLYEVNIKIYSSEANIIKLKENSKSKLNEYYNYEYSSCETVENDLNECQSKIEAYENRISELEYENENLESKIEEYKNKINELFSE